MDLVSRIIGIESGGNPSARNPLSSATGAGQFIESTWLDTISKARPDLVAGKSRQEILDLRLDPAISREMTEAYAADNGSILHHNGFPVTPGNAYLAHFAGPQGALKVLNAAPQTPIVDVLGGGVVKANPFLSGKSAGDVIAWANRKMAGGAPVPPAPIPNVPSEQPLPPSGLIHQFVNRRVQPQQMVGPPLSLAPPNPGGLPPMNVSQPATSAGFSLPREQAPALLALRPLGAPRKPSFAHLRRA